MRAAIALQRALGDRHRRHPRRRREALLGAGVGAVDAPAVELERDAAERGHAVGHQQRAAAGSAAASSAIGCSTPVEVSAWTTATSRASGGARAPRAGVVRDHLAPVGLDLTTPAPSAPRISAMRRAEEAEMPTMTVSPGSTRLTMPASMPEVPVPGAAAPARRARGRPRAAGRRRRGGSRAGSGRGARASALHRREHRGGTLVGPGPPSSRSGGSNRSRSASSSIDSPPPGRGRAPQSRLEFKLRFRLVCGISNREIPSIRTNSLAT